MTLGNFAISVVSMEKSKKLRSKKMQKYLYSNEISALKLSSIILYLCPLSVVLLG